MSEDRLELRRGDRLEVRGDKDLLDYYRERVSFG